MSVPLASRTLVIVPTYNAAGNIMDANLSHDPAYVPHFLTLLESFDVVVGSR